MWSTAPGLNSYNFLIDVALPSSISDDWSSTGFMEAGMELEEKMGAAEQNKFRDRREKERAKERAKVEKEKESDEGNRGVAAFGQNPSALKILRGKYMNDRYSTFQRR